ncbi:MAG: methyltransferase domain-containing protein [Alphaproteobacteria bacterium]|nr:methyltransferase domain-containing protein [Alphaproteobacteria bacterium]
MNSSSPLIFDRDAVRRHLARALPRFTEHDALFRDSAEQMQERIADVKRTFTARLDLSPFPFLQNATTGGGVFLDEELLPFDPQSFDLIASNLGLHWANDVPGALKQIHNTLKPEGLFIATLIGEQSLRELRACLIDAELSVSGGISPRLSPTIDLLTASQLMQRAGFSLPVVDKETVTLLYSDMFALMRDLRGMGQTNAHTQRLRHATRRAVFFEAARLYQTRFGDAEGRIPASFDILHLHGWK